MFDAHAKKWRWEIVLLKRQKEGKTVYVAKKKYVVYNYYSCCVFMAICNMYKCSAFVSRFKCERCSFTCHHPSTQKWKIEVFSLFVCCPTIVSCLQRKHLLSSATYLKQKTPLDCWSSTSSYKKNLCSLSCNIRYYILGAHIVCDLTWKFIYLWNAGYITLHSISL